jgi:hypothetical protein
MASQIQELLPPIQSPRDAELALLSRRKITVPSANSDQLPTVLSLLVILRARLILLQVIHQRMRATWR